MIEVEFYGGHGSAMPENATNGSFSMTIENEKAWPPFLEAGPGSKWSVTFRLAD